MATRVLITGAGGFVGSHLVDFLLTSQPDYHLFASTYAPSPFLQSRLDPQHIFVGDLTDFTYVTHLFQTTQPDIIFHLASLSIVQDSHQKASHLLTQNSLLQFHLLEAMRRFTPQSRLITICSANEYGYVHPNEVPINEDQPLRPLNPYAVSKLTQDFLSLQYHLAYHLDIIRLRPFNHTGERQTSHFVVPAFAKQIALIETGLHPPVIHVGNLQAVRDFTYVGDIVRAYLLAAKKGQSGQVYNIGSGKGVAIHTILDKLINLSSVKITIQKDPSRLRPADVPVLIADYSRFHAHTGWQPTTSLDKTLQKVLNYWRHQIQNHKE